MPNLRGKTWTSTTPANVEDAQYWEDHLISDDGAPKTIGKIIFVNDEEETIGEFDGSEDETIEIGGGGHKIINADGNEMPKQKNLQFLNAEVTDDKDKTVVDCRGQKGETGPEGPIGPQGVSVIDSIDNDDGTFSLLLSDGTTTPSTISTLQGQEGPQGETGPQGRGIVSIESKNVGKNHTLSAIYTDETKEEIVTIRDGADGSGSGDMSKDTYDKDDNGIVDYAEAIKDTSGNIMTYTQMANKADKSTTLAGYGITDAVQAPTSEGTAGQALITDGAGGRSWGDVSSLIDSVNDSEFNVTDKKLALADDVTKKLPNTVPTSAQKGYAPVVQEDGSVKWAKVSGGASYKLKVVGVIGSDYTITNLATSEETTGSFTTLDYVTIDVELGDNFNIVMTNGSETVQSGKVEIDGEESIKTVTLSYFTAYVRVTMTIGASATLVNGSSVVNVPSSTQLQQTIKVPSKGVWRLTASLYEAEKYTDITITDSDSGKTKDTEALLFALVSCQYDSEFNNTTIMISDGNETHLRNSDTSGVIVFATANAGKFTISGNYEDQTYSTGATMTLNSTVTAYLQTIPNGKTATPDLTSTWLRCAGITDKDEMTLAQIVVDGTLMNTLVQSDNANDYLVRSTSFATTLCASENAMTYLGMYDDCADLLLDDNNWLSYICNSNYKTKLLKDYVPNMTSDTKPKGRVLYASQGTYVAFNAFNKSNFYASGLGAINEQYIGYMFENPICVKEMELTNRDADSRAVLSFNIIATDDPSNPLTSWEILQANVLNKNNASGAKSNYILSDNKTKYKCYALNPITVEGQNLQIGQLQFYGRE